MDVHGFDPERAARLAALTAECNSLLREGADMDTVQELLSGRDVGVIDSIMVTRDLLGAGPGDLGRAKEIVLSSPARALERQIHQTLANELLKAARQLGQQADD